MSSRFWMFLFFLLCSIGSFAQLKEIPRKKEPTSATLAELVLDGGVGFNQIPIFTTGTENIYLSPGGGFSFGARLLRRIPSFEFSMGATFSISLLSRTVSNANAYFQRFLVDPQVKYLIKLKDGNFINPGAGIGVYMGGKMDIDARKIQGGERDIFKYNTSVGYFLSGEYEWTKLQTLTIAVGARYYNIRYDLSSVSVNNISFPTRNVRYEFAALDGSGIDLMIRLRFKL